jgi:hypothetical protein
MCVRCEASLRSNYENFGDSLPGMSFSRSVFTVFDYVENDMYAVTPKLGIASMAHVSQLWHDACRPTKDLAPQGHHTRELTALPMKNI